MNREIKFRCWDDSPVKDGFNGVMIPHDYMMQGDYLKDALLGKYPIMQFTGSIDRNMTDIYEDDILYCRERHYKVVKHVSGAYELHEIGTDKVCFLYQEMLRFEVVGNIYQNPELIS